LNSALFSPVTLASFIVEKAKGESEFHVEGLSNHAAKHRKIQCQIAHTHTNTHISHINAGTWDGYHEA